MTEIEAILPNCSLAVGDMVASTCRLISPATMANPMEGTLRRFTLAKMPGNSPSSAAALADCPTSSVQPASDPRQPTAAHSATRPPAISPSASRAASAKGAEDTTSSALGIIPMMTDELSTYATEASTTPPIVAIGTLRLGFSTTPAETEALSTPMKAHSVKVSVAITALVSLLPDTFQASA